MEIEIIGYNEVSNYRNLNIRKHDDFLIIKYPEQYREEILKFDDFCFHKNEKLYKTTGYGLKINITLSANNERSIKSNSLLWKIYTVLSKIINSEIDFNHKADRVTPKELYDIDMIDYGEKKKLIISTELKEFVIEIAESGNNKKLQGHLFSEKKLENNLIELTFNRTSSYWNQTEFSFFINMKIEELKEYKLNTETSSITKIIIEEFERFQEEINNGK